MTIHRQDIDGDLANLGSPMDVAIVSSEVIIPLIETRMEEPDELATGPCDASHIGALVAIAVEACQSEVFGEGFSMVLSGYDVLDFKRRLSRYCWK